MVIGGGWQPVPVPVCQCWLVRWLVGWLVRWLVGWLVGSLVGWLGEQPPNSIYKDSRSTASAAAAGNNKNSPSHRPSGVLENE